ncbi:ribosomal protein S18-alanine N-acetyltransferase [Catellatospora chokoriensis]|uniref:[Ribosomal protein bS18]-alanine N-acetyltransferase n=1 Tax=Catellatospora chokoriensis TaxID=310353 RepID=A0A8J3NTD7_9ACTN|nr:ribosomal protein S18-alanine N-acetyltransferase [Catellatospora chokoriensis]GIF90125.1 ribosomal-protein-alanine acetyltransferase [Catellatospora chokoriensis]
MKIERLRWWQIEDLLPVEADLFGAEAWTAAMFWNELANGHHYLIATEDDGTVLGYAGLAVGQGEGWVNNIAVRRDAQRRGIGRALLEALLAEGRRHQVKQVLLEVASDNAAAQRLYAGYGFEVIGIRKGYYQPSNTDALVMRREEGVRERSEEKA